jgi:hypothetical protein
MYLSSGLDPERVLRIPNGVDLERFTPAGERFELPVADGVTRFLFLGGLIWRKGPDVLLDAWRRAFAGRDDVVLVIKDVGAGGVYRDGDREAIAAHAAAGDPPRILLLDQELSDEEVAGLYRACEVLVHPYRGEGFAMPVLEAMACGIPAIVTEGGPTDEFCPPGAGWRIRAGRSQFPSDRVDSLDTVGRPWVLEPEVEHLAELLLEAGGDPGERARRGAAARAAAESYGWDAVAALYGERIAALAARPRVQGLDSGPYPFEEDVAVRLLATPAWRGSDRLGELLRQWTAATSGSAVSACLYLLADPRVDGSPEELEAHVLATGVELEGGADVTVAMEAVDAAGAQSLHASVNAYLPLHPACEGHSRMALASGTPVLDLDDGSLARFLAQAQAQGDSRAPIVVA